MKIYVKKLLSAVLALTIAFSVMLPAFSMAAAAENTITYTDEYGDFLETLGYRESTNRYYLVNEYGYMGRWQLGSSALQDIGFMDSNKNWTDKAASYGATSQETFLSSKKAQDYAIYEYHKKVWSYLKYYGATKYLGSEYDGITVTVAALIGAAHLVGAKAVKTMLDGGDEAADAYGTKPSSYMKLLWKYDIEDSITMGTGVASASVPTGLTASNIPQSTDSLKLTWNKSIYANGYYIYRSLTAKSGSWTRFTVSSEDTLSYIDKGLASSTKYYYCIRSFTDNDASDTSSNVTATTSPDAASGLTATETALNTVSVKWDSVNNASKYMLYRMVSGGKYAKITTLNGIDNTSYTDKSVSQGVSYVYTVVTYNSAGYYSSDAKTVTVKTSKAASVPTSFKAASVSSDSIKLSWGQSSNSVGYLLYRSTTGKSGSWKSFKRITSASTLSYTDSSLKSNTKYYYLIKAYTMVNGENTYSASSSVSSASTRLAAPASLKASSSSYSSVKLTWSKVGSAQGYYVYRSTTGKSGSWTKLKTLSSSTLSYTSSSLTTGTTYYYIVKAYNSNGAGDNAITSAKPVPSKPSNVTLKKKSSTSVTVSWSKVSGASGYVVYRAASKSGTYTAVKTTSSLSFTNTGLTKGKTYYYKVRAYRTVGSTKIYGSYSTAVGLKL